MTPTLSELEEFARLARMPDGDGGKAARKEAARQEAERLKAHTEMMFGTKKREKWQQMQNAWEEHKKLLTLILLISIIGASPSPRQFGRKTP